MGLPARGTWYSTVRHTIYAFTSLTLKTARAVCLHLVVDLDHLIAQAEAKLAEHESLDRDVRAFEKHCIGPEARRQ